MDYIKYIPEEMKEITEYKELNNAVNPTFTKVKDRMQSISNNHYYSELDEHGCARTEKIIGLDDGTGKSVEARRVIILSKVNNTLPYTLYNLKNKIKILLGNNAFTMNMDYANYHLTIRMYAENLEKINYVRENIESMIPCNIILEFIAYYNPYKFFKKYKFSELKNMTYKYMREHCFEEV